MLAKKQKRNFGKDHNPIILNIMLNKIVIFISVLFVGAQLNAQSQFMDNFFNKYAEQEGFTSVSISPKLFDMIKDLDIEIEEKEGQIVKELSNEITQVKILSTDNAGANLYEEFKKDFKQNNYELLMRVNDKGESQVDFMVREENNVIKELLLLVDGDDGSFTTIYLEGNISFQKIEKIIEETK